MTLHAQPRRRVTALDDPPPIGQLPSVRFAVVLWGGLALVDVCRVAGVPSYVGLLALMLLVGAASVGMTAPTALLGSGIAFLVADGFVVHRDGVLRYDGPGDLVRLALLIAVGTLATRVRR